MDLKDKIFSIGFNRTATLSLNTYLTGAGYKAKHDPKWWYYKDIEQFKDYNAFTDGYERYNKNRRFPDLQFLSEVFPNCKFVINTRDLESWMVSRCRHNSKSYGSGGPFFNDDILLTWVMDRVYWYQYINSFFNGKNNFIILNINDKDYKNKLDDFLNLSNNIDFPHKHKRTNFKSNRIDDKIEFHVKKFLDKYIIKKYHKYDWVDNDHNNWLR